MGLNTAIREPTIRSLHKKADSDFAVATTQDQIDFILRLLELGGELIVQLLASGGGLDDTRNTLLSDSLVLQALLTLGFDHIWNVEKHVHFHVNVGFRNGKRQAIEILERQGGAHGGSKAVQTRKHEIIVNVVVVSPGFCSRCFNTRDLLLKGIRTFQRSCQLRDYLLKKQTLEIT